MSRRALSMFATFALPVVLAAGCSKPPALQAIEVSPNAQVVPNAGETVQFKAIGAYQQAGGHPVDLRDITDQVAWSSTNTAVATIAPGGLATAISPGDTTVTAAVGGMVGTATLTVSGQPGLTGARDLADIMIIPASQTVESVGETSQYIAIGTYSAPPTTVDVTDTVAWESSDVKIATVNSAGLAVANACGGPQPCTTTITAIGKSNSGAAITSTATFTLTPPNGGGVVLPELTVYTVGQVAGAVTSQDGVINCSTLGGAGCTGNFTVGTTVVLTAVPSPGSTFGGWSSNCPPVNGTTCSITMNNNEPVGAIFNSN